MSFGTMVLLGIEVILGIFLVAVGRLFASVMRTYRVINADIVQLRKYGLDDRGLRRDYLEGCYRQQEELLLLRIVRFLNQRYTEILAETGTVVERDRVNPYLMIYGNMSQPGFKLKLSVIKGRLSIKCMLPATPGGTVPFLNEMVFSIPPELIQEVKELCFAREFLLLSEEKTIF